MPSWRKVQVSRCLIRLGLPSILWGVSLRKGKGAEGKGGRRGGRRV